jgi:hypothetical protein
MTQNNLFSFLAGEVVFAQTTSLLIPATLPDKFTCHPKTLNAKT